MKNDTIQIIQDFLLNKINPCFIIVFGSYAKGTANKNSDIDVAVFYEDTQITSYDLFIIAQELAELLNIEVDLVNLRTASTVFKAQVYTTGIVIYSKDDTFLKNSR